MIPTITPNLGAFRDGRLRFLDVIVIKSFKSITGIRRIWPNALQLQGQHAIVTVIPQSGLKAMDSKKMERWDKRYTAKTLVWSAGPNACLARELDPLKPGSVLDAACGEGRNALWLAEQGWQVTGIDFSAVGIDKARQIADRRGLVLEFLVADLARGPLPDVRYDLVIVLYLHTDPAERALWLPRLIDSVAPAGTFFYLGHDPSNIDHGVGGPQDPALLPSAAEITACLTGFDILKASVEQRPVSADPGHAGDSGGIAIDTLVRAVRRSADRD